MAEEAAPAGAMVAALLPALLLLLLPLAPGEALCEAPFNRAPLAAMLSSRKSFGKMLHCVAIAAPVTGLSPVSIRTVTPATTIKQQLLLLHGD